MTEISSSSGNGKPILTPRKSIKKDQLHDLQEKMGEKDAVIKKQDQLIKDLQERLLQQRTDDFALSKAGDKVPVNGAKYRVDDCAGKSMTSLAQQGNAVTDDDQLIQRNIVMSSPEKCANWLNDGNGDRCTEGFQIQPISSRTMVEKLMKEMHVHQDGTFHDQLDWTFIGEAEESNDVSNMTLRTGLLEQIYDMARRSDEFRVQLVDNIITFLRSKELDVEDQSVKSSLQQSIGQFTAKRNDLQHSLEQGMEDLDARVASCFAGISEFHQFREHFQEELDEIKKLYEVSLLEEEEEGSGEAGNFAPLIVSSPMKGNAPPTTALLRKSSMKSAISNSNPARVRFQRRRSNVSGISRTSLSPEEESCRDCARYRALLRSFRTTQEADYQKQREQAKTIEKLSTAITRPYRPSAGSTTLRNTSDELMDSAVAGGRHRAFPTDSPGGASIARRLTFDSPVGLSGGGSLRQKDLLDSCGSTARTLQPGGFTSTGTVTEQTTTVVTEFGVQTSPARKDKRMSGFIHMSGGGCGSWTDKDNRVDAIIYQNKISALELEISNLRNAQASAEGSTILPDSAEVSRLTRELEERTRQLEDTQAELKKYTLACKDLDTTCEEALKIITEEKEENASLKTEIQRLRSQSQELHNTTHDTSVAGVFNTTPAYPFPSTPMMAPDESTSQLRVDHSKLQKAYRDLEMDFRDLNVAAEELLMEKDKLQQRVQQLAKRETSLQNQTTQQTQQLQRTIDDLQKRCTALQAKANSNAGHQHPEKTDVKEVSVPDHQQLQRTIDELNRGKSSLQARINEMSQERNKLKEDVVRGQQEMADLRRELESARNGANHAELLSCEIGRLQTEVQTLKGQICALELENARLVDQSVRTEEVDMATLQTQDDDIRHLQDRLGELTKQVALDEIRIEQLNDEVRARTEAGKNIADEHLRFKGDIWEERQKSKEVADKLNSVSQTVFELNSSIAVKDQRIFELETRVAEQIKLLAQAQTMFDHDKKGFREKYLPWTKSKAAAAAQQGNVQGKKYTPRRSKTFAPADTHHRSPKKQQPLDFGSNSSTLPRIAESHSRETSFARTVVDGRNGATLPASKMSSHSNLYYDDSFHSFQRETSTPNSSPQKCISKVYAQQQEQQQQQYLQTSPQKPVSRVFPLPNMSKSASQRSLTLQGTAPIREPFLPAQHSHDLKTVLLLFTQKCSICLADLPGLHHAVKCRVCKHCYHKRCAKEIQSECAHVTELDAAETKQRLSLNAAGGRLSSGSDNTEPKMAGFLRCYRDLSQKPEEVYVTLVDEMVRLYHTQPQTSEDRHDVLEVIDLNEHRRQPGASVTCEKIPKEIFGRKDISWSDMVLMFSIKVDAGDSTPPRSWFFRARDILAKSNWTEAIGHVLMETEVDHADMTATHFIDKSVLSLADRADLEVLCSVYYDQYLLIGTDRGLFIYTNGDHGELIPVVGCDSEPVFRLGILRTSSELFAIVGVDLELKKADLKPLKAWIHTDNPELKFRPFANIKDCHLFEISGEQLAVATPDHIIVYLFQRRQAFFSELKRYAVMDILNNDPLEEPHSNSEEKTGSKSDTLAKCLTFSQEGLIVGLDQYYVLDLNSKSSHIREFLDKTDTQLSHWMEEDQQSEFGGKSSPMAVFPIPSAEAHKKLRNAADREYLLCFYDGGVFVDGTGRKTRSHEPSWKRLPQAIHCIGEYLYVTHYNSIQVRKIMPASDAHGLSPAFFMQMNEPRFLGLGATDCGAVFWGKSLRLPFRPEIRAITATITDEEVFERRNMRNDNDTASTSSLATTDLE
ncbi:putative Citron Rho-interacting kinase [Hypsibius exemplaris]|uniref:Citron Rho-interacting kinase n=1 Tax=Hypsibius exemplaris TaxID=2072580 RepID=A0A1W0X4G5_HYPEX|nr:putative Citron Rho-interacting kinase [Hypsibius exemplaris]